MKAFDSFDDAVPVSPAARLETCTICLDEIQQGAVSNNFEHDPRLRMVKPHGETFHIHSTAVSPLSGCGFL